MDEQDQEKKIFENMEGFLKLKEVGFNNRCANNCMYAEMNILFEYICKIGNNTNAGAGCNTFKEKRCEPSIDAVVGEFDSLPLNINSKEE